MAEIKLIKLITGEELVGEYTSTETHAKIKNPVRIMVLPGGDPSKPRVAFGSYADFSEDKEVTIHFAHIIAVMTPIADFVKQHKATFGGIVMPPSKLIV
jgi:hypothetical protein